MKYNNFALNEIKNHVTDINNEGVETAKVALSPAVECDMKENGLSSKQDYRMMYSAQREEDDWNYFAQRYGLELMPVVHQPKEFISADSDRPKAKVKVLPKRKSYVASTKHHTELEKEFYYRLKLEDDLDIKPIDNPFADKDSNVLIKIVSYEFKDPFFVLSVMYIEDEHDRLTQTRSLDETSEVYFTIDTRGVWSPAAKSYIENPQLTQFRRWANDKVSHPCNTFYDAFEQLIDRIYLMSTEEKIWDKELKQFVPNPDFIGYPTHNIDERLDMFFDRTSKDYRGAYTNVHISSRQIADMHGELKFTKSSDCIDVYYGDILQRTYKIHEA